MASIFDWSLVSADNANADADLTWAEGQAPGTVNASARTMMKRVAELLADMGGTITATGSANTLLVTANSAFSEYASGRMVSFKAAEDNTGAATLNVNSIGAKSLRRASASGDAPLVAGNIQAGCIYVAIYNTSLNSGAGGWALINETTSLVDYVTLTGTETLTNKTLTSPTINGGTVAQPTLTLKQGASEAPTAEGDIRWDTDDNRLVIGDGAATQTFTPNPASTVAGDTEYYTAANVKARLAKGTAKQVLRMNSGATAPEWSTESRPVGEGQTWQDMSGSRNGSGTYQNTTGRTIVVSLGSTGTFRSFQVSTDSSTWVTVAVVGGTSSARPSVVIPPSHYYRLDGSTPIDFWTELR